MANEYILVTSINQKISEDLVSNRFEGEEKIILLKTQMKLLQAMRLDLGFTAFDLAQEFNTVESYDSALVYYKVAIEKNYEVNESYKYILQIFSK